MAWNALIVAMPNILVKLASSYIDIQIVARFSGTKKMKAPIIDGSIERAAVVIGEPSLSLTFQVETSHNLGNDSNVLYSFTHNDDDKLILDFRATNQMAFDSNDFCHTTPPR